MNKRLEIKFILLLIIAFANLTSYAQNQIGLLPQINAEFKIGDDWEIDSKLEGRQLFFQNPFPKEEREAKFERTDLEIVATRSLSSVDAVGAGYLIRRQDGKFLHRFIQQYAIEQKLTASELSHRFRTDQTIEENEAAKFRFRYRIGFEKPLNGQELDQKEFYLKLSNEYLASLKDAKGNLEIRGLASLGYNLSDNNQIEAGIDYRAENLIDSKIVHKAFLNIGWYLSF